MKKAICDIKIANKNFKTNIKEVRKFNRKMLIIYLSLIMLLMVICLIAKPFYINSDNIIELIIPYIIVLIVSGIFLSLCFNKKVEKYNIFLVYGTYILIFALAIYLSIVRSPTIRGTIILGVFCVLPFSFIDRPLRVNTFTFAALIIHTILAFIYKTKAIAIDDLINCFCFYLLSSVVGYSVFKTRVNNLEMNRILVIENSTDFLMGILNRRTLFEDLNKIIVDKTETPSSLFMMDIDNFKEINDECGHLFGDNCLKVIGQYFMEISNQYPIVFYRYGGDEFVALCYGLSKQETNKLTKKICNDISTSNKFSKKITFSVGVSYCADKPMFDYEEEIKQADNALYKAKSYGKNRGVVSSK